MAYKYSTGSVRRGDIYFEDDRSGAQTYIDFGQDTITLRPSGAAQLYVEDEKVGIGTTSPDHTLHVTSPGTCHVKIESEAGYEAALKLSQDGQSSAYVWMPGSTSDLRFYVNGADVMHLDNDGNVGIGTTTPDYTLDVAGNMGVNEYIYHNGDDDTFIKFIDNIVILKANDKSILRGDPAAGLIMINNGNHDLDFQVKSDDGTSLLYTDAGNNRVGIGTTSPEAYLDIKNTVDDGDTNRTMIQMYNYRADDANENDWAPTSIDFKIENVAGGVKGATARIATVIAPVGTDHTSTEGERSSALIFSTMDDNTLAEAMRINNLGYVGIGTDDPATMLDVNSNSIRIRSTKTPASSVGLNGDVQGTIVWDTNYIYICTIDWDGSANIWKRVAIGDTW